jgi:hypothetical protein
MRKSPHFLGRRSLGERHLQTRVDRELGDELGVVRFEKGAASFAEALDLRVASGEGRAIARKGRGKETVSWSAIGRASGGRPAHETKHSPQPHTRLPD